jgi:hypothetical protein
MSAAAALAADPAIVSAKPDRRQNNNNNGNNNNNNRRHHKDSKEDHKDDHQYLPKVEKTKSSAVRAKVVKTEANAEDGTAASTTFPDVDFTTQIVVHTTADNDYVALPRASAANIPSLGSVPAAPESASNPVVVNLAGLHASALIAINEWIEKKGPNGVSATPFANPITHTELAQLLTDEWEISFSKTLLRDGEAVIGCINFAEKHGLKGLQQFGIAALSCAIRGKSAHEMASAMGHGDSDNFSEAEINAGRTAFADVYNLTKKRQ